MKTIFEYQNYRLFLKDYYLEQKKKKKNFSYRSFSEKAGINAVSYLFYVISGKRNLTQSTILKVSQAIGFSRPEADYFSSLVFFNQATDIKEKAYYYGRLVETRNPLEMTSVGRDCFEYYSRWYHCVIREVVTFYDFNNNYGRLGAFLTPAITGEQAKESVNLLEKLGFIELGENGLYIQNEKLLYTKTGSVDAYVLENFQKEMLQTAMKAYDLVPINKRMTTSTIFSISKESFDLFKMHIRELQYQLMELAKIDEKPEAVYQLNMNFFQISRNIKNDD